MAKNKLDPYFVVSILDELGGVGLALVGLLDGGAALREVGVRLEVLQQPLR
jgi:hypothetical protein